MRVTKAQAIGLVLSGGKPKADVRRAIARIKAAGPPTAEELAAIHREFPPKERRNATA